MKFVCANADLVQNINLDTDYDYITASSKSLIMAVETLANSFIKSKSDCVLFVWNTSDPADLVRATEEACVEDVNFKKIIDDLEKNLDYGILGDFDLESIELENGMTISVVKYVTMNNFVESKESATKSIKEERYNVELSDYSGSIVDEETFDKKSDAIQWAKDNGRNCYARIWDNEEGKTVKEWKVKSIKESADDNWYKLKMLNEMLDAMEEDEYNIPKLGIYGVTKNIDLDEGAIRALIKYYK